MYLALRIASRVGIAALLATSLLLFGSAFAFAGKTVSATPTTWSIAPNPRAGRFTGVSCVGPTRCVAVGDGSRYGTAEIWNGTSWKALHLPNAGAPIYLFDVSCVSIIRCVAVGRYFDGHTYQALFEAWNGTRWSVMPSTKSTNEDEMHSVSCVSATSCVAVGVTEQYYAIAEVWNGTRWAATPLPALPRQLWTETLSDVSCASATHCVAVGTLQPQSGFLRASPLVETWDGTHWTITPTPNRGNIYGSLSAVSCANSAMCFAVGSASSNEQKQLIERWNGTRWSIMQGADRVGGFAAISCSSATSCVAVPGTQIETWNGVRWSTFPRPQAGLDDVSGLPAISCTNWHCVAVGKYMDTNFNWQKFAITGTVRAQPVTVSWTAPENARLQRIATYLHQTPAAVQKTAVYALAYVLALKTRAATPLSLPPMASAAAYTTVWRPPELPVLGAVAAQYRVDAIGATRVASAFLSYTLALTGH